MNMRKRVRLSRHEWTEFAPLLHTFDLLAPYTVQAAMDRVYEIQGRWLCINLNILTEKEEGPR
jgi:hypothetical protein